ncbi:Uncharacterised protein [Klebsiella pneumoniae]|nr:Uncharacterised protein [Klebsiella pneumoniae]
MTSGVMMLARLPHILNTPPAIPSISFGEVSLSTHQPRFPKPLAKNARLMAAITTTSEEV